MLVGSRGKQLTPTYPRQEHAFLGMPPLCHNASLGFTTLVSQTAKYTYSKFTGNLKQIGPQVNGFVLETSIGRQGKARWTNIPVKNPPSPRRLSNPHFYSQGISNYDSLALLRLLCFHAIQERPMHREVDFMATLHPSLSMSAAHCIAGRGK